MLLFLSKFLALPFYPVGLAGLLGLLAAVAIWRGWKKPAFWLSLSSVLVLWLFSWPPFGHALVRSLERGYAPLDSCPAVSAVVVLGGAAEPALPPRQQPELGEHGSRLLTAARVFKQGCAPCLIVSGGKIEWISARPASEAADMARLLAGSFGLDSSRIVLEEQAKSTRDHAPLVKKIMQEKNLPLKIILVTSAVHMFRSVRVFQKAGFTVYAAPGDYLTEKKFNLSFYNLFPQVKYLSQTSAVLHEYYGIISYKLFGYI